MKTNLKATIIRYFKPIVSESGIVIIGAAIVSIGISFLLVYGGRFL